MISESTIFRVRTAGRFKNVCCCCDEEQPCGDNFSGVCYVEIMGHLPKVQSICVTSQRFQTRRRRQGRMSLVAREYPRYRARSQFLSTMPLTVFDCGANEKPRTIGMCWGGGREQRLVVKAFPESEGSTEVKILSRNKGNNPYTIIQCSTDTEVLAGLRSCSGVFNPCDFVEFRA